MSKSRLEAFSDGVLAIIITIMVLELHVPRGQDFKALLPLLPTVLAYVLSFIYVGIYWNNHHHLLHATKRVRGSVLWANLHLLFWLSLFPFVTAWMGENVFSPHPAALYGIVLMMAGFAYWILELTLIRAEGEHSLVSKAVGRDRKGIVSIAIYLLAVPCAFAGHWIAQCLYAAVALIWLVPDRRIERMLTSTE